MEDRETLNDPIQYGCAEVVKLFVPILICMGLVITNINYIGWFSVKDAFIVYTPFHEDTTEPVTLLWHAFANTFIFLTVIIAMTFLIVFLYKFGYMKIIIGMLVMSTVMLLIFVVWLYLCELFKALNWPLDYATAMFLVWNNAITGILAILWKGPLKLQQAYLIFNCSLMSLAFIKFLPEWTTWVLLFMISVWDLVAVLCPKGPLRMLVETAHSRGEDLTKLPALLYSSIATPVYSNLKLYKREYDLGVTYHKVKGDLRLEEHERTGEPSIEEESISYLKKTCEPGINTTSRYQEIMKDKRALEEKKENRVTQQDTTGDEPSDIASTSPGDESYQNVKENKNSDDKEKNFKEKGAKREENKGKLNVSEASSTEGSTDSPKIRGAKLGLGDFVFYSILIGKAAKTDDWTVILACILAILVGLGLTLVLLIVFKKALPALPISICLGLIMYFGFCYITSPFLMKLSDYNLFL